MAQFLQDNYQWIFSGAGVTVVVGLIGLFFRRNMNNANTHPNLPSISESIVSGSGETDLDRSKN